MKRHSRFPFLILACVFVLLQFVCPGQSTQRQSATVARKHKHHFLLFMAGLKSLATVVLIKMKIVVAIAALFALVVFTMKYLLGAVAGLHDLPGLLFKGDVQPQYPQHPPYQPIQLESLYGQGYSTTVPWDHMSHDNYGNDWSKIGDGGRNLLHTANLYTNYGKALLENSLNRSRKKFKKVI